MNIVSFEWQVVFRPLLGRVYAGGDYIILNEYGPSKVTNSDYDSDHNSDNHVINSGYSSDHNSDYNSDHNSDHNSDYNSDYNIG